MAEGNTLLNEETLIKLVKRGICKTTARLYLQPFVEASKWQCKWLGDHKSK